MVSAIFSIWSWGAVGSVAISGFCLQVLLAIFTWPFEHRKRITGRTFRLMAVASVKLIPQWRFEIHGRIPKGKPRRVVCVSNHCSQSDPFLISHLPWEMKWLGKSSVFKIPFVGWSMWFAGDIPVVRGQRDSVLVAMDKCKKWLSKDMPIMIFPEGTRSKTDELLPFKDGAFRLAIETGADIWPLAVAGTRTALPKYSWKLGHARGLVTIGEPISTEGLTLEDTETLKQKARREVEKMHQNLLSLLDKDKKHGADSD